MSQNINLFNPAWRKQKLVASLQALVVCLTVALLALGAYQNYVQAQVNGLAGELSSAEAMLKAQRGDLEKLKGASAMLKGDERLEADVITLAKERGVLGQLLFIGRAIDHPEVRARLRKADPKCHVACLAQTQDDLAKAIEDRDSDWVYVRFVPTADDVKRIRAAGKRTIIAGVTVNE